jgi:septum formation protein
MFLAFESNPPSSTATTPLVLASASPRRRSLLEAAGLRFSIEPSHVDEDFDPTLAPETAAVLLAERKARAAALHLAGQTRWIIAADTLVAIPSPRPVASLGREPAQYRYLGKPADARQAAEFLGSLSGTSHRVVTGVAVLRCQDGALFADHALTSVRMRVLSAGEIRAYVATGEWRDKAGGYGIQAGADAFVESLEGDFDTVVGLPVALVLRLLEHAGAPLPRGAAR